MVPVKRGKFSVRPVGIDCSGRGVSERVWVYIWRRSSRGRWRSRDDVGIGVGDCFATRETAG